jgi:hypothetical protein
MTSRTYDLYLPKIFKLWMLFFALFTIAVPIVILVLARAPDGPPLFVAALSIGVIAFPWLFVLRLPYRIVVHDDQRIEFVALSRRRTLPASDVVTVRPHRGQFGFLVVRGSSGSVVIANQFTGFHQLLTELATVNPAIQFVGC